MIELGKEQRESRSRLGFETRGLVSYRIDFETSRDWNFFIFILCILSIGCLVRVRPGKFITKYL